MLQILNSNLRRATNLLKENRIFQDYYLSKISVNSSIYFETRLFILQAIAKRTQIHVKKGNNHSNEFIIDIINMTE